MKLLIGRIGFVWFTVWFILCFLLLYPAFLILLSREPWYPAANRLRRIWAWTVVLLCGIRVKGTGKSYRPHTPAIYVANHTSYLDIIAFGLIAPLNSGFVAKSELSKIPLFGIFFRTVDIAVKRESAMASNKSMQKAAERMANGFNMIIFPEGTIGPNAPKLKSFKNGAFKLAIDQGVPVVPVTFHSNYRILPDEKYTFYPGVLSYRIHRAEPAGHLKANEVNALRDKIFTIIEEELQSKNKS